VDHCAASLATFLQQEIDNKKVKHVCIYIYVHKMTDANGVVVMKQVQAAKVLVPMAKQRCVLFAHRVIALATQDLHPSLCWGKIKLMNHQASFLFHEISIPFFFVYLFSLCLVAQR
jgi:hypothetical protein